MNLLSLSPTFKTTIDYLIGGDHNINLIIYQENSNVSNYIDCLVAVFLLSINQPDQAKIQNHLY